MSFAYNLSSIVCPRCQKNSHNLEVTRLHVFNDNLIEKSPYYDIQCHNCNEIFPINPAFCLKKSMVDVSDIRK